MPQSIPDPIRATVCRRCGRRPVAGQICAECEVRPSSAPSPYTVLDGGWTAVMHPEGEGYPVPYEVRDIIAAARAIDPERMDRRTLYLNLTEQREHQHRTGHTSRPRAPRRESFASAPKVATLPQVERRRRQLRRRIADALGWVVIVAACLLVGWAWATGIGGAR